MQRRVIACGMFLYGKQDKVRAKENQKKKKLFGYLVFSIDRVEFILIFGSQLSDFFAAAPLSSIAQHARLLLLFLVKFRRDNYRFHRIFSIYIIVYSCYHVCCVCLRVCVMSSRKLINNFSRKLFFLGHERVSIDIQCALIIFQLPRSM